MEQPVSTGAALARRAGSAVPSPQRSTPAHGPPSDELNQHLRTVIVAPMTTGGRAYPWRVACRFQRRSGFVALDQLRTVDAERLLRRLGRLTPQTVTIVLQRLQEMFAE